MRYVLHYFKKIKQSPNGQKYTNLVTLSVGLSFCSTPFPACFQLKLFAGKNSLFDF
jgi:hypothetical protein